MAFFQDVICFVSIYILPPCLFPLILSILLRSQLVPSLCSASDASSTKALNYALKVFLHEESQYPLLNYCWYAFNFSFSLSHTHKHIYVCLLLVMYLGIALWLGFFFFLSWYLILIFVLDSEKSKRVCFFGARVLVERTSLIKERSHTILLKTLCSFWCLLLL